jgi:thiosulfate dehydrogenase
MGRGILIGVVLSLIAVFGGAYLYISLGCMPANADSKPGGLETWAARKSLRASINREAPQGANPQALNDTNLVSGVHLYAVNCAICHGASDGNASNIAVGLYQEAPQLAKDGVEDDPEGKIFWKVKHGIRLTGMPSFSKTLSDDQIWQVTLFLKHMDSLPAAAQKEWKSVPSAASHT